MKQLSKYQSPRSSSVSNLRREMDRIFNELIPFSWRFDDIEREMEIWTPAMDLRENADEYLVEVDLPGLTKKDIHINCQDNVLTVEGERKKEKKEEHNGYLRNERYFGSFKRSFILPTAIVEDKIKATFKDGILKVVVPKAEKSKRKEVLID